MNKLLIITMFAVMELFAQRANAETCGERAESLNRMMAQKKPSAYLDAGFMYEHGTCVEQNWEKAGQYYQQAAQAGVKLAIPRLVALYAVQYRDPAAALWWAAQRPSMLSKACVPRSDPIKSTEAFLSELRDWSNAQLKMCTYYAGVISRLTIRNEIDNAFVRITGGSSPYSAEVVVSINPENSTVELYDTEEKKVVIARVLRETLEPDLSNEPHRESPMASLWRASVTALKEYGIPPTSEPAFSHKSSLMVARETLMAPRRLDIDVHQ